jgi:hypothetical protein
MRYGSLIVSAAVICGAVGCGGSSDSAMNADLAKDLAAARTSDALDLAPHPGSQTVVSAAELSPKARVQRSSSARATHAVARHTPQRENVTPAPSSVPASTVADAEAATENAPAPTVTATVASTTTSSTTTIDVPPPRPEPVNVSYPSRGQGNGSGGEGNGPGVGAIIGAIGGAILRGGVVDGDNCDPRGHHRRGGGILINRRAPIFHGRF